jgi:hypothetical protein
MRTTIGDGRPFASGFTLASMTNESSAMLGLGGAGGCATTGAATGAGAGATTPGFGGTAPDAAAAGAGCPGTGTEIVGDIGTPGICTAIPGDCAGAGAG